MQDLIAALGTNFVQSARSAGLSLRDVTASLAVLTRQGATAQLSATRLDYAFSLLAAPTDKAKKALSTIGLGAFQLAEDMRKPNGLLRAVQDLRKHLGTLPGGPEGIKANDVLVKAFGGARSFATIVALVQHTKDLKDDLQGARHPGGEVPALGGADSGDPVLQVPRGLEPHPGDLHQPRLESSHRRSQTRSRRSRAT